jgi:predicted ATPase/DNA-binding winged helix-turn-helix (wHTH) protein
MIAGTLIRFGSFVFRLPQRVLEARGRPVPLGSRATEILSALVAAPGELISHGALLAAVWPNTTVEESALRVHISKLRRALAAEDDQTVYIVNEAGRGYRFVSAVKVETVPDSLAPVPRPVSHSLPVRLGQIYGRSKIIDRLKAELCDRRFLTIAGPGGIGKTTVALAVAAHFEADGVRTYFVDFASVATWQLVVSSVALALGLAITADDPVLDILAILADENTLLVLDNCEHLVEPIAELAERLLRGASRLSLLVTSREPLRAEGEWVHRLPALPTPPAEVSAGPVDVMGFASVHLFVERAMAVRSDFELTPDNVQDVCDICRRLDGIPLALEFAAARSDVMDAATLALRLEDRFALLTKGRRTALPRQRTLRATMDWSYELLNPAAKGFLRRLAVFRSSFDIADAIAVAAPVFSAEYTALETVTDLCAKSLLSTERIDGGIRYRLLDTTRQYAIEKLQESDDTDTVWRRHAVYCRGLFSDPRAAREGNALRAFIVESRRRIDDLRGAIDWAFSATGEAVLGISLIIATASVWFHLSLTEEFIGLVERAIDALPVAGLLDTVEEIELLSVFAYAVWHTRWPLDAMAPAFARALQTARKLDNRPLVLRSLWGLWAHGNLTGSYAESLLLAGQFSDIAQSAGRELKNVQTAKYMIAVSEYLTGSHARALQLIDDVIAADGNRTRAHQAIEGQADRMISVMSVRMRVLWTCGFADQALALARQSATQAIASGHDLTICSGLTFGSIPVILWCGELDLARELLDHLRQSTRRRGLRHWATWADGFALAIEGGAGTASHATLMQLETFATFGSDGALTKLMHTGRHHQRGWCQFELLRRFALADGALIAEEKRNRLLTAFRLAEEEGALAWQLRAATSLALHDKQARTGGDGPDLLIKTLSRFSEGFSTRDLTEAADVAGGDWAESRTRGA